MNEHNKHEHKSFHLTQFKTYLLALAVLVYICLVYIQNNIIHWTLPQYNSP